MWTGKTPNTDTFDEMHSDSAYLQKMQAVRKIHSQMLLQDICTSSRTFLRIYNSTIKAI